MPLISEDYKRIETELIVLMWTAEGTLRRQVGDDPPPEPVAVQIMGAA
jgi:hypothetical protein